MTDPDSEAIETFLRGVAERELRHWRRSGGIGPPFPPLDKVRDAIGTLTRAEIADDDALWPILEDLDIALWLRSDTPMNNTGHFIRRMVQSRTMSALPPPPMVRRGPPRPEPLVVPLGRRIRVEDERAPCDLYLMTCLPPAPVFTAERITAPVWERMLTGVAERMMVQVARPGGWHHVRDLAADIAVLAGAGVIPPENPAPGQFVTLCERLGIGEHGIAAMPAAIPSRWASVISRSASPAVTGQLIAPLAVSLPDIDGVRFAVTGLTTLVGHSGLHVVAVGLTERFYRHQFGFSWWIRDAAGDWHVADAREPDLVGQVHALTLPVAPALISPGEMVELLVSGPRTSVRAEVPVHLMDN